MNVLLLTGAEPYDPPAGRTRLKKTPHMRYTNAYLGR